MKKSIIFILLSLIIKFANCQSFEFKSYGLKNSYSGNNVINANAKLIISKNDSKYEIKAFDPKDGSLSMDCNVTYLKTDDISGSYIYKGMVKFGQIEYGCILISLTKLSDFVKGKGNKDTFIFNNTYEIQIIYGSKKMNPSDFNAFISIYPITLVELNTETLKNYVEPKYEDWTKDIDGNEYPIIKIGNQVWMAKNLSVTHFRNGDKIPLKANDDEWKSNKILSYSDIKLDSSLAKNYGRLYTYYVVSDSRNVCPTGWHVPVEMEWNKLFDYLGGESIAGDKLKTVGNEYWFLCNNESTNESYFSAVGAGKRIPYDSFQNCGYVTYYWVTKPRNSNSKNSCVVIRGNCKPVYFSQENKENSLSIRCIKD